MMLVQYPLFAANVRVLCDKEVRRSREASSLTTAFKGIRKTYSTEGILAVYRGSELYLLHQATRELLKWTAERGFRWWERRRAADSPSSQAAVEDGEVALTKGQYRLRLATKYLIDAMCYPLLLASTRAIILRDDPSMNILHQLRQVRQWGREEGILSLFGGLCASMLTTALDEVMDWVLAWCIDYCAKDSDLELTDRILLKASGSSVVSIFTAPVNFLGVILRCQSKMPSLPDHEPLSELAKTLPWRGCVYQFALYGGIMAINVRLIQLKMQLRDQDN